MSDSPSIAKGSGRAQDRNRWRGRKPGNRSLGAISRYRIKIIWTLLLLAALLLFGWLIWLLLFAPLRTPFVVLSSAPYSWPLPPNAWATEDIEKMAMMDGENISLRGGDEPVLSKSEFEARLDREIQRSRDPNSTEPLIIWVSMHGVGDELTGHAYLIPSQSSPTDSSTWIAVDGLIRQLEAIPSQRRALLILDCQRMQVNWNIGLQSNHFSQCVQRSVREQGASNLTVLLAASSQQRATVSAELRGSTFGHFLRQGLAGAADNEPRSGNRDGWVTVSELHAYVRQRVDNWALRNRGVRQNPLLLSGDGAGDFRLTRSLNQESLAQLLHQDRQTHRAGPTIPGDRLDKLWRRLDEFRALRLYQREPLAWRDLEHRLLWLEQLSTSGSGYRGLALRTFDSAEGQVQSIARRAELMKQSRFINDHCSVVSGDDLPEPWRLPNSLRVHSLPLAEYFGTLPAEWVLDQRRVLDELGNHPSPPLLAETLSTIESGLDGETDNEQFVRMLFRYQFSGMWRSEGLREGVRGIQELLKLQAGVRDLAVPRRDGDGLLSDARVHGWTRQLVSRLDVTRRQAEDILFVQGQPGLAEILLETKTSIQDAVGAAERLEQVIHVCDRAMAETPYLARWLTHPLHRVDSESLKDSVDNRVLPLIFDTSELSRKLSAHAGALEGTSAVAESVDAIGNFAGTKVAKPLEQLSKDWNLFHTRLLVDSESDNPQWVGELEAVLSIPLVTSTQRQKLRAALHRLSRRLHENSELGGGDLRESEGQAEVADTGDYADRIAEWKLHPMLAILGQVDTSTGSTGNPIERFLEEVKGQLSQQSDVPTLAGQRTVCSAAARQFRAAAPIWFAAPSRNPVVELRQIDLQSLLIWHAERSLDDFWGPAGGDRAFFDTAATDYLDAASSFSVLRFAGEKKVEPLAEISTLNSRLAASRQAASGWLTTRANSAVQLDSGDHVTSQITVQAATIANGFRPPEGTATVMVRDAHGRLDRTVIEPSDAVSLPAGNAEVAVTLPPDVAAGDVHLEAQTVFRGHEYSGALNVEKLGGITVVVNPHVYQRSEVTLNGPWNKLSVDFILDCSRSMENPMAVSGKDGAAKSRMDVAKLALQEMLFSLGLRRNVRVGIHLFGRRMGWSTDPPVRPLIRPDLVGVVGDETTPSEDVESVLRLSRFDLSVAQGVIPQLNDVQPWGQSPLYLAAARALNDFGVDDSQADRHVIVITDGANYQYIPAGESNVRATTAADVRAVWGEKQVPVHILGLGMERTGDQTVIEEFTQLCLDTGGRFQSLSGSTDLTTALANLLGPGRYHLARSGPAETPEQTSVLGRPIGLSPTPQSKEHYLLTFDGRKYVDEEAELPSDAQMAQEELWLEGGESLQLFVSEQGNTIDAYPFLENVVAQDWLVMSDGTSTNHVVRMHRPERDHRGHVRFPVSWQRYDFAFNETTGKENDRWRVTDRPAEFWVEIQPLLTGGQASGQPYVFFDTNYEPEQPVPLMNLVARDWPKSTTRAKIRVWSQPSQSSGFELLPPSRADADLKDPSPFHAAFSINESLQSPTEVVSGVTLRFDPATSPGNDGLTRWRFVLKFDDANRRVSAFKLDFPAFLHAKPKRIVRQFDPQHRMAVHTYYFDPQTRQLPDEIEVTNQLQELSGSWRLSEESLSVDIPQAGMFLPVSVGD